MMTAEGLGSVGHSGGAGLGVGVGVGEGVGVGDGVGVGTGFAAPLVGVDTIAQFDEPSGTRAIAVPSLVIV